MRQVCDDEKCFTTVAYVQANTPEEITYIGTKGYIRLHAPAHCPTDFTMYLVSLLPPR